MDFEDSVGDNNQLYDSIALQCQEEFQLINDFDDIDDRYQFSPQFQENHNQLQSSTSNILQQLDQYHEDIIEQPNYDYSSESFIKGRNIIRSNRINNIDNILSSIILDDNDDDFIIPIINAKMGENRIIIDKQSDTDKYLPDASKFEQIKNKNQFSEIRYKNNKEKERKTEETQETSSKEPKSKKSIIHLRIPKNYKRKTVEDDQITEESQEYMIESSQDSTSESSQDMSEPNDQINEENKSGTSLFIVKERKNKLRKAENIIVKDGKSYTSSLVRKGLKRWLYEHKKNPYPTIDEKIELCCVFGITRKYLDTFFRNARLRKDYYPKKRKFRH